MQAEAITPEALTSGDNVAGDIAPGDMDRNQIVAEIIAMLASHRKESSEGWSGASTLADLGVDSFDLVEFVFLLEDRWGIEIDYNANQTSRELATIADVADLVCGLIEKKRSVAA